jgi:hypothetical protein
MGIARENGGYFEFPVPENAEIHADSMAITNHVPDY